jgi:hypothetical protein
VTGAWLRLRPVAGVLETYRIEQPTNREAFEAVRSLANLTSVRALIWSEGSGEATSEVFLELGSSQEGLDQDRSVLAQRFAFDPVEPNRIDSIRDGRNVEASGRDEDGDEVVIRLRVLGSRCEALRRVILDAGLRVSIDPGLGVIHARGTLSNVETLLSIRTSAEQAGGFATFEKVPDAWRSEVGVFGSFGGTEDLIASLKAKFDPAGILNPGRYVAEAKHRAVGVAP